MPDSNNRTIQVNAPGYKDPKAVSLSESNVAGTGSSHIIEVQKSPVDIILTPPRPASEMVNQLAWYAFHWAKQFVREVAWSKRENADKSPFYPLDLSNDGSPQRKHIVIPATTTQANLSDFLEKVAEQANGGRIIFFVGHGSSGDDHSDAFIDLLPSGFRVNETELRSQHPAPNSPVKPMKTPIYEAFLKIGKVFKDKNIKRVVFLSCKLGNNSTFLDLIYQDWQVSLMAYRRYVISSYGSKSNASEQAQKEAQFIQFVSDHNWKEIRFRVFLLPNALNKTDADAEQESEDNYLFEHPLGRNESSSQIPFAWLELPKNHTVLKG